MNPLDCPRPTQRKHPQFKLTPAFRYALGLVCEACADPLDALSIRHAVLDVETVGGGRNPYGKLKALEDALSAPDDNTVKLRRCVGALADLMMSEATGKAEESSKALETVAALAGYVPVLGEGDHWVRHLHCDNRTPWFPDSTIGEERPYLNPSNTRTTWKLRLGDGWWGPTGRRVVGLGPLHHSADIVLDDDNNSNAPLWEAADLLKLHIAEGFAAAWAKAETVGEIKALGWLLTYEQHSASVELRESNKWLVAHRQAITKQHIILLAKELHP